MAIPYPPEQAAPDLDDNEILMPIVGPQNQNAEPLPPALPVMNLPNNPEDVTTPKLGTVLGIAIKTGQTDNTPNADDQPDDADDKQTDDKNVKKKTFVTKEYGLKRRVKTQRKFKCGVCTAELETV